MLPRLVASFVARFPRAALHLETLPSRELIHVVLDGRLELGLGPFARSMAGLSTRPLGSQRMVLYAGRGTAALARLRREGARALASLPLVTSRLESAGTRQKEGRLRDRFRTIWEVQSLDLRMSLVRDGLAVGYLPESSVRQAGLSTALRAVEWLDFGVIERTVGLFFAAERPLSEQGAAFVEGARG